MNTALVPLGTLALDRTISAATGRGRALALAQVNGVCARAVIQLCVHGDVDCTPDLVYALARRAASFATVVLA